MIGSLRGRVLGLVRGSVVVETGGVGYRVTVPVSVLSDIKEGADVFLWTHLAVRENAQDLYGFTSKDELSWFELLLTVSGVGPKSAISILNAVDTEALRRAIAGKDPSSLSSAYGVGKKTAEKIVLELREKVGAAEEVHQETGVDSDVLDALVGLGYSTREAREAVRAVPKTISGMEARIKEAIRIASSHH